MRKLFPLGLILALALTACSAPAAEAKEYDIEATPKALLDSGAFSETPEALDADLISGVYNLTAEPSSAAAYTSTGATAEEVVVLVYADSDGAAAGKADLERRVADQKEACQDYLPLEIPKLEGAVISQSGNSVLLVVASDYDAVQKALEG